MTNRIVIQASGMKISKPGVNVLTAGQEDLIFDTDHQGLGVYQTGTVSISGCSTSAITPGGNREGLNKTTVSFSSLGYIPMAAWQWWPSGGDVRIGGQFYAYFYDAILDGAGDPTGSYYTTYQSGDGIIGQIFTNKLELYNRSSATITCRYVVFYQKAFT